jgi:hypothetical protein
VAEKLCDGIHALFQDAGWMDVVESPFDRTRRTRQALMSMWCWCDRPRSITTNVPLEVIGRAGAGVDTIDVDAATSAYRGDNARRITPWLLPPSMRSAVNCAGSDTSRALTR